MFKAYPIPAQETSIELKISNSRFIGSLAAAVSVEQAKQFIATVREKHPHAHHHVPAYIIGYGLSTIAHCSDDGEPHGTAGKPLLVVLKNSGLGDAVLVVTRYFGGTKLGSGGLVRAYTETARLVIEKTPRMLKTLTSLISFRLPYSLYEPIYLLSQQFFASIEKTTFEDEVTCWVRLEKDKVDQYIHALNEKTYGKISIEIIQPEDWHYQPYEHNR